MGSKSKISIELKSIFDLNRTSLSQYYVEPFVGGCNMIDKMKGHRIASDNNIYLISLWQGLQQDLNRPNKITKQMYENAKKDFQNGTNEFYSNFLIGLIGFMASFNGKFFNGFVDDKMNNVRDYQSELKRSIEKQTRYLKDVSFYFSEYQNLIIPNKSIIYCDIPYKNTTKYETGNFNHFDFYDWSELKFKQGHKIFISEYSMPEDRFTKIWTKQVESNLSNKNQNKIECLFIPKNQKIKQYATLF